MSKLFIDNSETEPNYPVYYGKEAAASSCVALPNDQAKISRNCTTFPEFIGNNSMVPCPQYDGDPTKKTGYVCHNSQKQKLLSGTISCNSNPAICPSGDDWKREKVSDLQILDIPQIQSTSGLSRVQDYGQQAELLAKCGPAVNSAIAMVVTPPVMGGVPQQYYKCFSSARDSQLGGQLVCTDQAISLFSDAVRSTGINDIIGVNVGNSSTEVKVGVNDVNTNVPEGSRINFFCDKSA